MSHLSSAVSVAWPVSSSSWAMDRAFPFLTKLLAKTPYAERNQDDGKNRQRQEIRSEEHTSELQSLRHLVCRLLLEKITAGQLVRLPTPRDMRRELARQLLSDL